MIEPVFIPPSHPAQPSTALWASSGRECPRPYWSPGRWCSPLICQPVMRAYQVGEGLLPAFISPGWLLLMIFLLFLYLEVVSRTSCYITSPRTEVRLISSWSPSYFFLLILVVGMTFSFLQSLDTSPSHPEWSRITQKGSAITSGSPFGTGESCSSAIIFLLSWISLHHFIANSRSEVLQTSEAFKGTALLQTSVGFEGVHVFFPDRALKQHFSFCLSQSLILAQRRHRQIHEFR